MAGHNYRLTDLQAAVVHPAARPHTPSSSPSAGRTPRGLSARPGGHRRACVAAAAAARAASTCGTSTPCCLPERRPTAQAFVDAPRRGRRRQRDLLPAAASSTTTATAIAPDVIIEPTPGRRASRQRAACRFRCTSTSPTASSTRSPRAVRDGASERDAARGSRSSAPGRWAATTPASSPRAARRRRSRSSSTRSRRPAAPSPSATARRGRPTSTAVRRVDAVVVAASTEHHHGIAHAGHRRRPAAAGREAGVPVARRRRARSSTPSAARRRADHVRLPRAVQPRRRRRRRELIETRSTSAPNGIRRTRRASRPAWRGTSWCTTSTWSSRIFGGDEPESIDVEARPLPPLVGARRRGRRRGVAPVRRAVGSPRCRRAGSASARSAR